MMTGTVYKSSGNLYSIKVRNGVEFQCRIKGKLRMEGVKSTNPIAVGDIVEFDVEGNKSSVLLSLKLRLLLNQHRLVF